ncbi:hypothetical protein V2J09_016281 [Rumex salicifolius]
MFIQFTPEYMDIYERFKVAKYWQKCLDDPCWSLLRNQEMFHTIVEGDYELSFLKAEAERISAVIGAIISRGLGSNHILDRRHELMWLHSASNRCLIAIESKYANAIESLLANEGK